MNLEDELEMIDTLEKALERISELEKENKNLLSELEYYRNRNYGGRKRHNKAWTESYNNFVNEYENGTSINEIVKEGKISRRTVYRYKAYYVAQNKLKEKDDI